MWDSNWTRGKQWKKIAKKKSITETMQTKVNLRDASTENWVDLKKTTMAMNNWLWLISSLNMNFTTMHRIELKCAYVYKRSRQTDTHRNTQEANRTKQRERQRSSADWIEQTIESCKQTAIGIMISRTNKNMNTAPGIQTRNVCVSVYLLSYFIKTVLLLLWIENCLRPTHIVSGKASEWVKMDKEWEQRERERKRGGNSHTTSDEMDLHSKTYAQCWTFSATPNLNYCNHTIWCVYLILIYTYGGRRGIARLVAMGRSIGDTKRRQFDGITNEKAKNNNNNIRLMSLFFSFYWHTEYNGNWYVIVL